MRFIHAADLHIDSPLRGLDRYEGAPAAALRAATRDAFIALVDLALAREVDFVLLAGDIYDGDWLDFHTGMFFRNEMRRLERHGIAAFVVHGNHDAASRITRELPLPPNVTVFAADAAHSAYLEALDVAVHGQSFAERKVDRDLVPGYPEPVPGAFNIGLLHTSLNGREGHDTYAPTTVAVLENKGYDYWALGHVHAREVVAEAPRIVFPGNLQGRHANETGPKGCELVTVSAGRIASEFVPLDVVRWGQVRVELGEVESLEAVAEAFKAVAAPFVESAPERLHALRVELAGASPVFALEARQPGTLEATVRASAHDLDVEVWIEQVRARPSTVVDREARRGDEDAVAELIRLVDDIAADPAALDRLFDEQLGKLLGELPPEVRLDAPAWVHDAGAREVLLREAEAVVLARLAEGEPS